MKKNKKQNITIAAIAITIVGSIIAYNYSAEQTRQRGFEFGNELTQIQQDVAKLQSTFYSEKTKWDEGDIPKNALLEYYEKHIREFEEIISRYDKLDTPESFQSSVELFKISSQTQLDSDIEYIKWITTGDDAHKIRSDTQIQQAYEYENLGLVKFQLAKTGITDLNQEDKFTPPNNILKQKVIQIYENMKDNCDDMFKNEPSELDINKNNISWLTCLNDAKQWKQDHLLVGSP